MSIKIEMKPEVKPISFNNMEPLRAYRVVGIDGHGHGVKLEDVEKEVAIGDVCFRVAGYSHIYPALINATRGYTVWVKVVECLRFLEAFDVQRIVLVEDLTRAPSGNS